MGGIIERIGGMAGSDVANAVNLAHDTFQKRLATHGHHGRAMIEAIVKVARHHPALVGLAVGILVEQLLARAEAHEEVREAVRDVETGHPPSPDVARALGLKRAEPPHVPHIHLRFAQVRPFRLSMEVFGALLLLKFSAGVAHAMRRKNHREIWFAPAAKVKLISATIGTYYAAKSVKSKRISAWRNAAAAGFLTDALKPVLKLEKRYRQAAAQAHPPLPPPAPAVIPPPPAAPEPPALAEAHHDDGHDRHGGGHNGHDNSGHNGFDGHGHGHDSHGHDARQGHNGHAAEPHPVQAFHQIEPAAEPAAPVWRDHPHDPEPVHEVSPEHPAPVYAAPEPAAPIHVAPAHAVAVADDDEPPAPIAHEPVFNHAPAPRHDDHLEPEPDAF
jgi:hypothetical protein